MSRQKIITEAIYGKKSSKSKGWHTVTGMLNTWKSSKKKRVRMDAICEMFLLAMRFLEDNYFVEGS